MSTRFIACLGRPAWPSQRSSVSTRHNATFIQPFTDAFISVANALPLPSGCPPYATTIILGTIVLRSSVTLPLELWSRRRTRHLENVVKPEVSKWALAIRETLLQESRKKNLPYEEYTKELSTRLIAKRREIYRNHGASPLVTLVVPPAVHIPIFVAVSVMLRNAVGGPSPLSTESFVTLPSLAGHDPTGVMPVLLGLITLTNIEFGRAMRTPETASRSAEKMETRYGRIVGNALRCGAVVMIPIAAQVPGAMVLYWITSASFTLTQNVILRTMDGHRRKLVRDTSESTSAAPKSPR